MTLWLARHIGTCSYRVCGSSTRLVVDHVIKHRDSIKLYLYKLTHTSVFPTSTIPPSLFTLEVRSTSSTISPVDDFSTTVVHAPMRHVRPHCGATFSPGGVKLFKGTRPAKRRAAARASPGTCRQTTSGHVDSRNFLASISRVGGFPPVMFAPTFHTHSKLWIGIVLCQYLVNQISCERVVGVHAQVRAACFSPDSTICSVVENG